ncbi:putative cyclin-dependent protein kinase inhibitor SMR [Helianthus annuus]|nr:putative cyclin-dependent protein kinase inhibitor SMR [Helianthus annuus]
MATSNLDPLIVSLLGSDNPKHPDIRYHQCNSSSSSSSLSSQTPYATNDDSHKDQNTNLLLSGGLKIQVPSSDGEFKFSNVEDDPKTPRSTEHRIPVTAACPPAPRKATRVPVTGKRKTTGFFPVVRVPADFIVYVDAMLALNEAVYVPDIVVGDLGNGDRAKKLKLLPAPAHDI